MSSRPLETTECKREQRYRRPQSCAASTPRHILIYPIREMLNESRFAVIEMEDRKGSGKGAAYSKTKDCLKRDNVVR